MTNVTRRRVLQALGLSAIAAGAPSLYAVVVEPAIRLRIARWDLRPQGWRRGHRLRIAVLTDFHAGEPTMPRSRLQRIVKRNNGLGADIVVILGDLTASHRFVSRPVPLPEIASALGELRAPLGVYAVLGNHDWWDDPMAQARGTGPVAAGLALEQVGIPVLENQGIKLGRDGQGFWLAGLGDQWALWARPTGGRAGVDDLPGTLAQITDADPVILLAHEPDIFPKVPDRVALTLSGHIHGGQIRLFGWSPKVPSRYGNRYAYGPVNEGGRDLVVSGGLGCSIIPVRLGVPPEITLVTLS